MKKSGSSEASHLLFFCLEHSSPSFHMVHSFSSFTCLCWSRFIIFTVVINGFDCSPLLSYEILEAGQREGLIHLWTLEVSRQPWYPTDTQAQKNFCGWVSAGVAGAKDKSDPWADKQTAAYPSICLAISWGHLVLCCYCSKPAKLSWCWLPAS